jgi:hypothetical protein
MKGLALIRKADVQELPFAARDDFRTWLRDNSETSDGVWLVFGKTKALVSLSANDALISPAYENCINMPPSVRFTYTRRYLSFKTEEARRRDFEKIVDRLNKNLKPM